MESPDPPLPNFLVIGAQKSATRWLRSNLGKHPDIYTAGEEIAFFSSAHRFRDLGVPWYREQFAGWAGERVVGEATPAYTMRRHHPRRVARRIDRTLPGVRLIALLRDPIDRAQSAVVHHIHRGRLEPDARLVDVARRTPPKRDPLGIVSGGWYAQNLRPFQRRFGDRLLLLWYDDVQRDPAAVFRSALAHLGVDADFVPPELERVRYSTRERVDHVPLAPEDRIALWPLFARDVAKLERRTGRDLSAWRPSPVAATGERR
jgi:hypothetical protein